MDAKILLQREEAKLAKSESLYRTPLVVYAAQEGRLGSGEKTASTRMP